MNLRHHETGARLLERAGVFLRSRDTLHSVILGLAERTPECFAPYFATVEADDRVLLVAVRTPPHNLVLSTLDGGASEDALDCLVADLAGRGALPGVTGPAGVASSFGDRWAAATGATSRVSVRLKSFEADRVQPPAYPPGELRVAREREVDLLLEWADRFVHETGLPEADRLPREEVLRRIQNGIMRVWARDDTPMTMAAVRGGALPRIGSVYTPPEHRRRGYASACVAALTAQLIDGGARKVTLMTDAANPTSNKIYIALGYRYVGDDVMIAFDR